MCDCQCTSVSFYPMSNRIESKNRFVSVNRTESNPIIFPRIGMLFTVVTESWEHEEILDCEVNLTGHVLFRCDRILVINRGGGVLLYVKSIWELVEFHTKTQHGEHVWCQIGKLVIGVT